MPEPEFEQSVFINCPFDEEYSSILQAVAFCVVLLGFFPRFAPENADGGLSRLERIAGLIHGSKYGIHDLSRCKSQGAGEYYRLNMPFELGMDHACRRFGSGDRANKTILVLEREKYDYQKALSDIAGWDIEAHGGRFEVAVGAVRSWLINQAGASPVGTAKILGEYLKFQEWYWDREIDRGSSEDDIRRYPTREVVAAMLEWRAAENGLGVS